MEQNFEKSIWQIISSFIVNKDEFSRFTCLVHIPAKRLEPTFLNYLIFQPKNCYFIISKELEKPFDDFKNSFIDLFEAKIINNMTDEMKIYFSDVISNINKINLLILKNEEFSDFLLFKARVNSLISDLVKKFNNSEIIIDVTGGKKLHSIICAELSSLYHLAYSYLNVEENHNKDGISAQGGTERLYIQYPDSKKLSYLSIHSFPLLSISNSEISCFYDGTSIFSDFYFEEETRQNIINLFSSFSNNFTYFLTHKLEKMLEPDFHDIVQNIRNIFPINFLNQIESYIRQSNIFSISLNKRFWNFPFEFIFTNFDDLIILRSIPRIEEKKQKNIINKNDNSNKINSKIKFLLVNLSEDEYMNFQYNELKEYLGNISSIELVALSLPEKKEFLEVYSKSDISHIICHGQIIDDNQVFILEKPYNKNKDIIELYKDGNKSKLNHEYLTINDFIDIKSPQFVFISACASLTLNVDWDKTIYFEMAKNGCKTIVGTHWAIPQFESSIISKSFYENFISGKPVGMALNNALKKVNNSFLSRNYYIIGNHTAVIK